MKDIRLHMDGANDTLFDFRTPVEGKELYAQKVMVNLATDKGSDPLYADRGTNLMADALGGSIVSNTAMAHSGNFAALDTMLFVNAEEYAAVSDSPDRVVAVKLLPASVATERQEMAFDVQLSFRDGTVSTTRLSQ